MGRSIICRLVVRRRGGFVSFAADRVSHPLFSQAQHMTKTFGWIVLSLVAIAGLNFSCAGHGSTPIGKGGATATADAPSTAPSVAAVPTTQPDATIDRIRQEGLEHS